MMTESQIPLFENTLSGGRESGGLSLLSRPGQPLTKGQRVFNRLVAQVEQLRARLHSETRRFDAALAYYGQHLHPRLRRLIALRKDFVRMLAPFLEANGLKRKHERETLRTIIAEQIDEILQEEGSLADADLRILFEEVNGVDFEQIEREDVEDARSAIEAMLGEAGIEIDLSDIRPGMSDAAIAVKMAEIAQTIQQKTEQEQHAFHRPERRKTKRQLEKEQLIRQTEEVRKKSIASIYKQLAKALHPDLEPDPGRRERKVALMQELTTAYRKNDLHTLLRLELEWIQGEQRDLNRLTEEKLAIYNQALKDQVKELQIEIDNLPYHPRYQPLAVPDGPFDIRLRTDGPAQVLRLDGMIVSMEAIIARMRSGKVLEEVRGIVRGYRSASRDTY